MIKNYPMRHLPKQAHGVYKNNGSSANYDAESHVGLIIAGVR